MKHSNRLLFMATAGALLVAACSSGGSNTLGGLGDGTGGFDPHSGDTTPPATPTNPAKPPAVTPPAATPPPATQPGAGPGSKASPAHQDFVDNVFPKMGPCSACHASGANGAPKFLQGTADAAYIAMDGLGLIKTDSLILSKGPHSTGAPALTSEQTGLINTWLAMEATERVGQKAPTNLLDTAAKCGDPAKFPVALTKLLTTKRTNENGNQCIGCNNTQCASCHLAGEYNVEISSGRTGDNAQMVQFYQSSDTISRFIGINGTELVASNAFKIKSDATVADQRSANIPKHPQFILDAATAAAIDLYAQDIITKFKAGTCPK